jgi:signal transduction histidine kinase
LTAALGIGAGVYLSGRAQRRIDDIANTLTAAASGDLACRIATSTAGDDLDQVAHKINAMLAQLQRLIQNVNQASTDIAHDLKKPLSRLRERLELATEKASEAKDFQETVQAAIVDVDSIVATFEALLNISQLQAGDRRARFTDVDLKTILSDVIDLFGPVVEDAGARLTHNLSPAKIRGDRELLVQLFANLVENALRHCPKGVAISLTLESVPQGFVACVADNGPGIPEAERDNVFRRFYRLESARSSEGHGLGLSLVAAIADLHGATVVLGENHPGLSISLTIPKANKERR